jgi:hypothetical protein
MTENEIRELAKNTKWGFLRETDELAKEAGIDKDTGLIRTGLPTYLKEIYPDVNDWIHDEIVPNTGRKTRPDYRSETLKLIIEFDGLPHYQQPDTIKGDKEKTELYTNLGYKVVRIPYFIQLSKSAVKTLFDVELEKELFDERIPSLGIKGRNTPAFLCGAGVKRMAEEFHLFPEQYKWNVEFLEQQNDDDLSGVELLKTIYNAGSIK